jgi:hypothetical protein
MHSLTTLRKINAERCKAPLSETETSRHCSHCVSIQNVKGKDVRTVVLHSAKQRNTTALTGDTATRFLVEFQALNSQTRKDALIERYFASTKPVNVVG